jgi:hypothetical protein
MGFLVVLLAAGGCTFDASELKALPGRGTGMNSANQTATDTSTAGTVSGSIIPDGGSPGVCLPGASIACGCPDGQQGIQVCTLAMAFAPCASITAKEFSTKKE